MFDFLKDITVADAEVKARKAGGSADKNPMGLAFRLYYTGAVYPSAELVEFANLEYGTKPADKEDPSGNGLDIIDSRQWAQVKLPEDKAILFVAAVPRKEPKISLFGSTGYEEDGTPISSVLTQGTTTFGKKTLIQLVQEIYGIVLDKEKVPFVDLVVATELGNFKPKNNISNIPKTVARGDKKDELSYIRRENLDIYALVPATLMEPDGTEVEETQEKAQEEALVDHQGE